MNTTMTITTDMIRELRARTGVGVMDCKEALAEAGGDMERAIKVLREKGKAKAAKKADRMAHEGVLGVYVHTNQKLAGIVSVRCETDFVARSASFQQLAKDLAMHVVASDPLAVSPEDIPEDIVRDEREAIEKEVAGMEKPVDVATSIAKGKLDRFLAERSLLLQPFVKDPSMTVGDLLTQKISELGENIVVGKFSRVDL